MFITEINSKKLKKPLEVKVSKTYLAETEDPEFYGEGCTEEEAINDLKLAILDMYDDFTEHDEKEFTDEGDNKLRNKVLGLFE